MKTVHGAVAQPNKKVVYLLIYIFVFIFVLRIIACRKVVCYEAGQTVCM